MKYEWWYDDSFIDYEMLGVRDQELFLVRLTINVDGTAELLFPSGDKRDFKSDEDALLWLGDEEFCRLNGLIEELVEEERVVAQQITTPSGDSESELLPKMRYVLSPG